MYLSRYRGSDARVFAKRGTLPRKRTKHNSRASQ
jgi:hypothetical protein